MQVDLAPYEIELIQELLRERRRKKEVFLGVHEGHFPDYVKRVKDIDAKATSHCHNRWCRLGQVNILLDKLEKAWQQINEDLTTPSYMKILKESPI